MTVTAKPRPRATYQDVLKAPDGMVDELVYGALHLQPRRMMRHARTIQQLSVRIEGKFDAEVGVPPFDAAPFALSTPWLPSGSAKP